MKKVLIVVDMQNDFIDGSLANKDAQSIVEPIARLVESWGGDIIFTRDTHFDNYLDTLEGKYLPVPHCNLHTSGWDINPIISNAANNNEKCNIKYINKENFGVIRWDYFIYPNEAHDLGKCNYDEIYMCGTCTDICVVSNALILKSIFTETPIKIYGNLCAGVTKEKHGAALEVMRSCQCEVIDYDICKQG